MNPSSNIGETIRWPDRPNAHVLVAAGLTAFAFEDLMDVYAESNRDNTHSLYLELPEDRRLAAVHQGFKDYLSAFFEDRRNRCYILFVDRLAVCALRIKATGNDRFLIEGLETRNEKRNQGSATFLLRAALDHAKTDHPDAVFESRASNPASVKVHRNVGFQVVTHETDGGAFMSISPTP